jgi:hypothetical protein
MWINQLDYSSMAKAIEGFSGKSCTPERARSIVVSITLGDSTFERLDSEGKMLRLNAILNDRYTTIPKLVDIRNRGVKVCNKTRQQRRLEKKKKK